LGVRFRFSNLILLLMWQASYQVKADGYMAMIPLARM
jgi:hypothetical protein